MKTRFITIGLITTMMLFVLTGFSQRASKVIFYRTGCVYGLLAHYKVIVDGKELFILKNKSIQSVMLDAGNHTISPKQSKRAITLDVQAGHVYVVKYRTMIGILGARPRLKIMTLEEAKKDSKLVREYADKQ